MSACQASLWEDIEDMGLLEPADEGVASESRPPSPKQVSQSEVALDFDDNQHEGYESEMEEAGDYDGAESAGGESAGGFHSETHPPHERGGSGDSASDSSVDWTKEISQARAECIQAEDEMEEDAVGEGSWEEEEEVAFDGTKLQLAKETLWDQLIGKGLAEAPERNLWELYLQLHAEASAYLDYKTKMSREDKFMELTVLQALLKEGVGKAGARRVIDVFKAYGRGSQLDRLPVDVGHTCAKIFDVTGREHLNTTSVSVPPKFSRKGTGQLQAV